MGFLARLPFSPFGRIHGNYVGANWTAGRVAANDEVLRFEALGQLPPAVDHWDELGMEHDLALAHASSRADFARADIRFATGAVIDGLRNFDPLEVVSGLIVGGPGLLSHQFQYNQ
jgi:hypothetical protein